MQTHNVALASSLAEYAVSLGSDGRIEAQGTIFDVLEKESELLQALKNNDDDEEEAAQEGEAGEKGGDDGEGPVKKEPRSRKSRDHTPSNELPSIPEAELATFKKRELLADAEYLDGMFWSLYFR